MIKRFIKLNSVFGLVSLQEKIINTENMITDYCAHYIGIKLAATKKYLKEFSLL